MRAATRVSRLAPLILALTLLVAACRAPDPVGPQGEGAAAAAPPGPTRPLIIVIRVEPASVAARSLQQAGTSLHVPRRIFNALLALIDDQALPRPDLAESLPELDSDSWRVFPDGRMETTYRLKPNLAWHDGAPLTSEDFVFSWRVYASPGLGLANTPPLHAIEAVAAPDPRTVTVQWRLPYPGAATLSQRDRELPPLPRHLLDAAFEQQSPEAFATHPYWTRDYVGVGPYRIERWEPGAFIDAAAFDRYALGRPGIDRIQLRFISDSNTALATLLSGDAQVATDNSIGQVVDALKGEWAQRMGGKLIHWPNAWRSTAFQLRPELATPRAILDVRVRKALAHAVDKQSIDEAVYGGDVLHSESMIWSRSEWGPATERPLDKYPYDLRRSEELMNQAGFQKGPDGVYARAGEGRFSGELGTTAAADFEQEMLIMVDGWRRVGLDIREFVLPAVLAQDSQARATFPTMFSSNTNMGEPAMLNLASQEIPRADNRWRGGNRGGWSNPQYDRLIESFNQTLGRPQRIEQVAQLLQIYSEELPSIPLFFRAQPLAHLPSLRGPALAAPESSMIWNVHMWELGER